MDKERDDYAELGAPHNTPHPLWAVIIWAVLILSSVFVAVLTWVQAGWINWGRNF